MNKEELNILYKFFDARQKVNTIGSSDYSPIIYLINENEKIVKDLDKNAINFLDSIITKNYILSKINNNNRYDAIVKLLQTLNKLDKTYNRNEITVNVFLSEFDKEEF